MRRREMRGIMRNGGNRALYYAGTEGDFAPGRGKVMESGNGRARESGDGKSAGGGQRLRRHEILCRNGRKGRQFEAGVLLEKYGSVEIESWNILIYLF